MMLDGNALAGRLQTIFGVEMTATSIICAQLPRYERDG